MKYLGHDGLFCAYCGGLFPDRTAIGSSRLCDRCVGIGAVLRSDGSVRPHYSGPDMQFVRESDLRPLVPIAIAILAEKGLIYWGTLPKPRGGGPDAA